MNQKSIVTVQYLAATLLTGVSVITITPLTYAESNTVTEEQLKQESAGDGLNLNCGQTGKENALTAQPQDLQMAQPSQAASEGFTAAAGAGGGG